MAQEPSTDVALRPSTARAGSTERMNRTLEGLEAGQYWRAVAAVEKLEGDDPRFDGRYRTTLRAAVPEGHVLLVERLNFVDGLLHSVDMAPHPRHRDGKRRFLTEELFTNFVYEPQGKELREKEIAEVMDGMRRIETEMRAGPEDLPRLAAPPKQQTDVSDLVAYARDADRLHGQLEAVKANAVAYQRWVKGKTDEMARQSDLVASYFTESATAMQASISETIAHSERMMSGVRSLKLYTGEDVEVETYREGAPADPSEPLTIYQRRLFLDEEVAVETFGNGLDSESMGELRKIFVRNPGLVDRIAPAPRSVVLMRLRRHHTPVPEEMSMMRAMEESTKARLNQESFLFVRNGENVHLVLSNLIWSFDGSKDDFDRNGLVRLFPSAADLDKPFKGVSGREIGISDLDYSDARRRFDDRALAYKRLLILMWGLQDRTGLFGDFSVPANWMDLDWQAGHFRFVRDDEAALEKDRETWYEFVRRHNAMIQPGSRILCRPGWLISPETTPSLYSRADLERGERSPYTAWAADSDTAILTGQKRKDSVVVPVPVHRTYPTGRKNVLVDLDLVETRGVSYLCLDAIRPEELEALIESRRDREDYLSFLKLFQKAWRHATVEAAIDRPTVDELTAACLEADLADETTSRAAALDAVRFWRAANKGVHAPTRSQDARAFEAMAGLAFTILGHDVELGDAVAEAMEKEGRKPLRLVVGGDGTLLVYATLVEDERIDLFGDCPFVARIPLRRVRDGVVAAPRPDYVLMRASLGSEKELRSWPASSGYVGRTFAKGVTYDHLRATVEDVLSTPDVDVRNFVGRSLRDPDDAERIYARMRKISPKGRNERVEDLMPLALVVNRRGTETPSVLCASSDAWHALASASPDCRRAVANSIRRHYKNPERHLEMLDALDDYPELSLVSFKLADWVPGRRMQDERGFHPDSYVMQPPRNADQARDVDWRQAVLQKLSPYGKAIPFDDLVVLAHPSTDDLLDGVVARWKENAGPEKAESTDDAPAP